MKRILAFWLVILLCAAFVFAAGEEPVSSRLRRAGQIGWAGDWLMIDGDLIDLRSGAVVRAGVTAVDCWEGAVFLMTEEGPLCMDADGTAAPLNGWPAELSCELLYVASISSRTDIP